MAALALLAPGQVAAARLVDALRDSYELVQIGRWSGLKPALARRDVEGAIVDPYNGRSLRLDELHDLRIRFPEAALIVFAEEYQGRERDLLRLGALGVDAVLVDPGAGHMREFRERLDSALELALANRLDRLAADGLPPFGVRTLREAVLRARRSGGAEELAASLGTTPQGLQDQLRREGLPAPRRFLLWGRLIVAAWLLGRRKARVEDVAFRVQYATAAALRNALRRTVGTPPLELAARGGWRYVAEAAIQELVPTRDPEPPPSQVM